MKTGYKLQTYLFGFGVLFAYYTLFEDFDRFLDCNYSVFTFGDTLFPNPFLTPCFYGAFVFLIGFIYSRSMLNRVGENLKKHQRRLMFLALAGTTFAWANTAYGVFKFYFLDNNTGCSGVPVENPFITPCSIGALIFTLCLEMAIYLHSRNVSSQPD